jgi:decaprenylphospho-beta-D-ribofuranose 2-oxidase
MVLKVFGWGRSTYSHSALLEYATSESLPENENGRGVIPRGLGRSYGDSALNSGGILLDSKRLNCLQIDKNSGVAIVGGGVSISTLENESMKDGYFPFVVPGTAKVTLGGAIASDIHGKSHHKIGSFSNQLLEIKLLNSAGIIMTIRPSGETAELFWATVGGMGLTGMIVEATLKLKKIETSFVNVQEKRVQNLDELLEVLIEFNQNHYYTVAWIDLSGKFQGRGIVSGADHIPSAELPSKLIRKKLISSPLRERFIFYPFRFSLINKHTIKAFNAIWFYKPVGKRVQNVQKYMHPLDGISNWNVIYGKKGFIQYQFVVPFEEVESLKLVIAKLKDEKCFSFLTVLKSFGESSNGLIGFPMKGLTLAVDLPVGNRRLLQVLDEIDDLVLRSGGRIYLTKDSRMSADHLEFMYPKIKRWKSIKKEVDPENYWQSDQGRRLNLC